MNDNDNHKTVDLPATSIEEHGEHPIPVPPELPGARLATRRRELGLTLDQVSQKLKLSTRQIAAIEANDFASLAGIATVKGFIRSYAKGLDMDPDPLVKMVAGETSPAVDPVLRRPLPSSGFPAPRYSSMGYHRDASKRLSGIGALIVIFLAMLAFSGHRLGWITLPYIDLLTASDTAVDAAVVNTDDNAATALTPAVSETDQNADGHAAKILPAESGKSSKSGVK